jgi:hypothetical protein
MLPVEMYSAVGVMTTEQARAHSTPVCHATVAAEMHQTKKTS